MGVLVYDPPPLICGLIRAIRLCRARMEEWESEADFQAHMTAPHVAAFWESAKEIYDEEEQIHSFYGPAF